MSRPRLPRPVHGCNCGNHAWTALTRGYVTLVSVEDTHLLEAGLWNAMVTPSGPVYARSVRLGGLLHRIILQAEETDHENRNGLDNRRFNLRPCTRKQNQANRGRKRKHLPRGVYAVRERFIARLRTGPKAINLGTYDTAEEAACAYDTEAKKHFGEFARLNFP